MSDAPLPRGNHPAPLRSLLRLVVDHNPFYILSAVCMLAGCLTLVNSRSYSPLHAGQLLALVLTLSAYELLLVGLGLFLIVRRGVRRDGLFLLLIEALFLVDMAFLNAEVYSVSLPLGAAVNAIIFTLAAMKLTAIFRVLRFPLNDGLLAFTLCQLLILLAMPGIFAKTALGQDGRLPPWMMYGAWWLAGLLPVGYLLSVHPRGLLTTRIADPVRNVLTKVLLLAPILSLIVHLCTANWVYKLHFNLANVAPLLIGLAVAIGHHDTHATTYGRRVRWQLVLPALAILLSISFPNTLVHVMPGPDWTPLRIALLAAGLVYLDGYWFHRHGAFAFGMTLCAITFGMGPSVSAIGDNATAAAERTEGLLDRLTPRTPQAWGVVSVVASFFLLGIGFGVSLLKPRPAEIPSDSDAGT